VCKVFFVRARRQRDGAVPEFARVLHGEMAEAAEPLDRDDVAGHDAHFTDPVEDGYAGAEEGGVFCRIGVGRDAHRGFTAERAILCVCSFRISSFIPSSNPIQSLDGKLDGIRTSPITRNPVDQLIITHLEKPAITRFACPIVRAMPGPADAVSDFPSLLAVAGRDDGADDFMAGGAGEGRAFTEGALLQETVRVAHAAGVHFDEDFAGLGELDWDVFDGPRCAGFLDDDGATGFGDIGCHCGSVWRKLMERKASMESRNVVVVEFESY
jgi:hypothetical protein